MNLGEKKPILIEIRIQGICFSSSGENPATWLTRHSSGTGAELAAFLEQLLDEGFATVEQGSVVVGWKDFYEVQGNDVYRDGLQLFQLPESQDWRPVLSNFGSLTDSSFKINLTGWIGPKNEHWNSNFIIKGGVFESGQVRALLSKDTWQTLEAIREYHARPESKRDSNSNRIGWAEIRQHAVRCRAKLSDYLQKTIVLTPKQLKIELSKTDIGTSHVVEIIPTFDAAPRQWIEVFDAFKSVPEKYFVADSQQLFEIILSKEVRSVLNEIKGMPGRRVASEKAHAFLRNPFAALGSAANSVIDPDQFESARESAGIVFSRFMSKVVRDNRNRISEVGLIIEEPLNGRVNTEFHEFPTAQELESFLKALRNAMRNNSQVCLWDGFELEILGDTPSQEAALTQAWNDWVEPKTISLAEILDLSSYSGRIEGFGEEKSYFSPYIARKKQEANWVPENIIFGISFPGESGEGSVAVSFDEEVLDTFRNAVQTAKEHSTAEIEFPGLPRPILVSEAEQMLQVVWNVSDEVTEGTFDGTVKKLQTPAGMRKKFGLVIKPNIESLDYVEARGKISEATSSQACLPRSLKADKSLKDHQYHGVAWLQALWQNSPDICRGGVLADDMGLGKTLQLLTFIIHLVEIEKTLDPVLVVAPVSLLENWQEEIRKFFDDNVISVLTLYGTELSDKRLPRRMLTEDLRQHGVTRLLRQEWLGNAQIVLTTYETMRDLEFSLAMQRWSVMICDEAQKIKNPNAMMTRAAKKQNARLKIACTGTPVENTLTDLWCLFDFVQPGLLGALSEFGKEYRKPIEAKTDAEKEQVEKLRAIIKPQILRRQKSDVAKDLPKKILDEQCLKLNISDRQRALYAHAVSSYKQRQQSGQVAKGGQLGLLQHLRRLCSDPRPIGQFCNDLQALSEIEEYSPKMRWLLQTLKTIQSSGEKAIIFCELKDVQRLLRRCVSERFGICPDIINGDVKAGGEDDGSRQKRIRRFQERSGFGVIILSPLAAGFGLNIQAANHVIHFTRTWNPAKEDQATDRAYRIGQTKDVYVYYPVITADDFVTFDAKLHTLLDWKRNLSKDMLNGSGDIKVSEFVDLQSVTGESALIQENITPDDVQSLDPNAFEALCAALWSKRGYSHAYRTPRSGDGGVDVVCLKGGEGVLIQCKSSSKDGHELGWEAVRDVVGGFAWYSAKHPGVQFRSIAVTNQFFNAKAKEQAQLNKVLLVERPDLDRMLRENPVSRNELEGFLMGSWEEEPVA